MLGQKLEKLEFFERIEDTTISFWNFLTFWKVDGSWVRFEKSACMWLWATYIFFASFAIKFRLENGRKMLAFLLKIGGN